jgi:hypothetical protein
MEVVMGDPEFYAAILTFLVIGTTVMVLLYLEVRASWKQREDANKLLILALFRTSRKQIKALEEQTRRMEALLEELRAGRVEGAPPETGHRVAVPSIDAGEEEAAAEDEAAPSEARRQKR